MARIAGQLTAHPAAVGGSLVMMAMTGAIMVNALAMQPGRHPSPLFGGDFDPGETGTLGMPGAEGYDAAVVAEIQRELGQLGVYDGAVDGVPGPRTRAAIERYELLSGLPATGEADESLLDVIRAGDVQPVAAPPVAARPAEPAPQVPLPRPRPRAELAAPAVAEVRLPPADIPALLAAQPVVEVAAQTPAPAAPARDERVARIQGLLDLLGYGPVSADGRMNEETRAAIRRFEENRGMPVTGTISEAFLGELRSVGALDLL
jgi:peptidoglycan hydrolase-like protein with peptidoglycan-binding domain